MDLLHINFLCWGKKKPLEKKNVLFQNLLDESFLFYCCSSTVVSIFPPRNWERGESQASSIVPFLTPPHSATK